MTKKDSVLLVPENINKLAKNYRDERVASEKLRAQQEEERKTKEKALRAENLKNGLVYARKIFLWTNAFRNSSVGQELMKKSHIPTAYNNIFFFDGHVENTNWVGLVVNLKGLCLNHGGRYSNLFQRHVHTSKELAESVDTRILKEACEWLDNGKVWECIERRFDYLNKKKDV